MEYDYVYFDKVRLDFDLVQIDFDRVYFDEAHADFQRVQSVLYKTGCLIHLPFGELPLGFLPDLHFRRSHSLYAAVGVFDELGDYTLFLNSQW